MGRNDGKLYIQRLEQHMKDHSGHYEILPDYNVVICRVSEHWALDCAERYIEDIKQTVSRYGGQPWCRVVNMLHFQLATPEVVRRMHEFGLWSMSHGCLEHAFIFANDKQKAQVEEAYHGLFDILTFDNEQDAITHCCRTLRANFLRSKIIPTG